VAPSLHALLTTCAMLLLVRVLLGGGEPLMLLLVLLLRARIERCKALRAGCSQRFETPLCWRCCGGRGLVSPLRRTLPRGPCCWLALLLLLLLLLVMAKEA